MLGAEFAIYETPLYSLALCEGADYPLYVWKPLPPPTTRRYWSTNEQIADLRTLGNKRSACMRTSVTVVCL